ncbi:3'-5' exonuclease [Shewanella sp. JM162201]|uniref:3'-5' exonuclease n=1 Tax=Shewanella jiangmenensis TaxID=2837387 RepID=A0ABS5V7R4_9GAMM|nr:3'-5' exonuclease [Shewanella jiangmenensis]MBT1446485.1 3'-5' exonuclease [Shewanella jiangmenensis]
MVSSTLIRPRLWWKSRRLNEPLLAELLVSQRKLLSLPLIEVPLLAIDMEMTGLNPLEDQILAIAVAPLQGGMIKLSEAQEVRVAIAGSVGQSAAIHGITDRELKDAMSLDEAMRWLISRLHGHIAVAHHAPLDLRFVGQGMAQVFKESAPLLALDTLQLERARLLRCQDVIKEGSLRLGACRERYGLPVYHAHNALTDALACAELLLAQLAAMGAWQQPLSSLAMLSD